jgi:HlyD family secretion protein
VNTKLFRQVSIDRLSSPEQLDQVLGVTSPRLWLAIVAVLSVLVVTCVWGFTGSIPSAVAGQGLIIRRGGVFNVPAQSNGIILDIHLKPGDRIKPNQVIATVAQPVLAEKMRSFKLALQNSQQHRMQNLQTRKTEAEYEVAAYERQRASIGLQVDQLTERAKYAKDKIPAEERLYAKGLITHDQVVSVQQQVAGFEQQIDTLHAQLTQIDSQEFAAKAQPEASDAPLRADEETLQRDIAELEKEIGRDSAVVSPSGGEVVEVKVYSGSSVTVGQPLLSIQPDENSLEVVAYLPAALSKDAKSGLEIQVSPLNIKREEYGFLLGDVTFVSDYPTTPEALMRNFENQTLVSELTRLGPVTEIRANLRHAPSTVSGFQWSTSQGPAMKLSSGTICIVQVVTRRQIPATLAFPYLKRKLGIA